MIFLCKTKSHNNYYERGITMQETQLNHIMQLKEINQSIQSQETLYDKPPAFLLYNLDNRNGESPFS